jgi:hypothetical protein
VFKLRYKLLKDILKNKKQALVSIADSSACFFKKIIGGGDLVYTLKSLLAENI